MAATANSNDTNQEYILSVKLALDPDIQKALNTLGKMRGCHACGWFVDDKADHVKNEAKSAGVKKSWLDENVREARSARHAVEVEGVTYRSVREAFKALGLPDAKHIKFRGDLKKAGEGVFEGHDFKLVQE